MKNMIITILGLILFLSCDSQYKNLGKTEYSVGWVNMPELTNLCWNEGKETKIGVLQARITDVYWNEKYILAAQCDLRDDAVIAYWIVELLPLGEKNGVPCIKHGPYNYREFENEKLKLGLNVNEMNHYNFFK